jgi:hypothetical protein
MKEHEFKQTVQIDVYYPEHPPRKESRLFKKTKHHLIAVLNTPCWICGDRSEAREVHHFHAEWADSEAIDWDKMRMLHPNFPWSTFKEPTDFIDSEYNMMVLCEKHHRRKNHGIHMLPYPIWIMQRNQLETFKFSDN